MAKMFYTMDETKAALGKSEDEIKTLSREGKLREFRDGPRLMFKADQVEGLKSELAGAAGDQIGLSAGDTHAPMGLMDSKTGSGSGAGMKADTAGGPSNTSQGANVKDDTASAMDVGLSGSMSGSIGGGSLAGGSMGGSMGGSGGGMPSPGGSRVATGKPGVNVFGDETEHVDPMAQTHITPPKDQISLEGVGSGSGLLDLTRETDDTSLGAALLDEISPGSKKDKEKMGSGGGMVAVPSPSAGSSAGMTSISPLEMPGETRVVEPMAIPQQVVEADDPIAPAFALGAIAASVVILLASLVLIGVLTNDNPMVDARIPLPAVLQKASIFVLFGVGLAFAAVLFVVGIFIGKMGGNRATA